MVQNKYFRYKAVPSGWPEPNKDLDIASEEFDLEAPPPRNGFITKNLYAAFDPSQRGRMRDSKVWSYSKAMEVGKPVESVSVIGKVLKSDNSQFKEGEYVILWSSYTETYSKVSPEDTNGLSDQKVESSRRAQRFEPASGVPFTAYINALGMTGMTAYGSLHEIGTPRKGETIWVSATAGAVGLVVAQVALREGLKVIGSVGDDKKLEHLRELGITECFNYKKEDPRSALKRLAPDGIDIFYDNVGGEQLDIALEHIKVGGRIGTLVLIRGIVRSILTHGSRVRCNLAIQQPARARVRSEKHNDDGEEAASMAGLSSVRSEYHAAQQSTRREYYQVDPGR